MTIYVFGGSNSLARNGWTRTFAETHAPLVNRSIGATAGFMGLYRLLTSPDVSEGDVVIWEYAINDQSKQRADGNTPLLYLRALEYFLIEARHRGLRVVPLVMKARGPERNAADSAYYKRLKSLISHYGLERVDISEALRAKHRTATLGKAFFRDGMHHAETPEVLGFIADAVSAAIAQARVPAIVPPRLTGATRAAFAPVAATDRFRNSILDIPYRPRRARFHFDTEVDALAAIYLQRRGTRYLTVKATAAPARSIKLTRPVKVPMSMWLLQSRALTEDRKTPPRLAAGAPVTLSFRSSARFGPTSLARAAKLLLTPPIKVVGLLYATPSS